MSLKVCYIVITLILTVSMLIYGIQIGKKTNDSTLVKPMQVLIFIATFTVSTNIIAHLMPTPQMAMFFQGFYYGSTDFLLVVLVHFINNFIYGYQPGKQVSAIIYGICSLDAISLFINNFTQHAFVCKLTSLFTGETVYEYIPTGAAFTFHLVYCYVLMACAFLALIWKIKKTTSIYKRKYALVFTALVVVVLLDAVYLFLDLPLDISLIFYVLIVFLICYLTFAHIPKMIITEAFMSAMDNRYTGAVCYDNDGQCIYANAEALKMLGIESGGLRRVAAALEVWLSIGRISDYANEHTLHVKRKVGENTYHYEIDNIELKDKKGKSIGQFYSITDRTNEINEYARARFNATHDSLTKVYNREHFYEEVGKRVKGSAETHYMMCLDIKDFKLLNDLFGMEKGDEVLIRIGEVLHKIAGAGDLYGRLDDDRFAVCTTRASFDEHALLRALEPVGEVVKNGTYNMVVHIGVYEIVDKTIPVSLMCDRAKMAISKIKKEYQSSVAYYDDEIMNRMVYERRLLNEFEHAMEDGQFHIFLQPQTDRSGKMLGAEALVRWMHPENGIIPPGAFIVPLERAGFIHRLDQHVWELACRQLAEWKAKGLDYYISVNISTKDFYYLDIYKTFTELVEKYEIEPQKLKLEITETAIAADLHQQLTTIDRLRNYGFCVEIDDFGSGYSSLSILNDIRVDVIKIDMGFLRRSQEDAYSQTILRAIVDMFMRLNMPVIVEGVETEEQLHFLIDAGCGIFQGYFFARPMSVEDFEARYFR